MSAVPLFIVEFLLLAMLSACSGGQRYAPERGGFSVELPAEPVSQSEHAQTPLGYADFVGGQAEAGGVRFGAAFAELPNDLVRRAGAKAILQGLQQLDATAAKAKIADVAWDGDRRGMRYVLLTESGDATARYDLMRENRLIRLAVSGPLGEVRGERASRFFASFEETR